MQIDTQAVAASALAVTGTTCTIFNTKASASTACTLNMPGSRRYHGKLFRIYAAGTIFVSGTAPSGNIVLFSGGSLTTGSNTVMGTLSSAQSLASGATYPWVVEAVCEGDDTTGKIQGSYTILIDNVKKSSAALDNELTTIDFDAEPSAQFCIGVTWGVGNANNSATMLSFTLEK